MLRDVIIVNGIQFVSEKMMNKINVSEELRPWNCDPDDCTNCHYVDQCAEWWLLQQQMSEDALDEWREEQDLAQGRG